MGRGVWGVDWRVHDANVLLGEGGIDGYTDWWWGW